MNFLDPSIALYVATAVALIVWLALFAYLWTIDRRTREITRRLEQRDASRGERAATPLQPVRNQRSSLSESEQR